jgi:hypothetical protein
MLTRLRSMLLADGVLTTEDLALADASRQALKSDFSTELLLSRRLSEALLTRYLGRACSLPTVGPDDFYAVVPGVLGRLPLHRARQLLAVPFHEDATDLRVAVSAPLPSEERERLEAESGKAVRQYVTPEFRIAQALHLLHGAPLPAKVAAVLAVTDAPFRISLAAVPFADRWAGRNWSTSEVVALFDTSSDRDEILLAALSFLGAYFPRRILLAVGKGKVQGYGFQGLDTPARPIESLELKPAPGSPLALLCERDEAFRGPPHRAGLSPLYHGLGIAAPDELLAIPVRIANRTAMLAICDLTAGHDLSALPVVLGAISRMSEALQRLILIRKGSRTDLAIVAALEPTTIAPQPIHATAVRELAALSTLPMPKFNPATDSLQSPPSQQRTPEELEAVRIAAESAVRRSATLPLETVGPGRSTALLSPVANAVQFQEVGDESLAETGPERPSPLTERLVAQLASSDARVRAASLRAGAGDTGEIPELPSGAYAIVPSVTQGLEPSTPLQRVTGILAELLEETAAAGNSELSATHPQPFKATAEIRTAAESWLAARSASHAAVSAEAESRHHDAHTHRLRGIAAEPVALDLELAITQTEPRPANVEALLASSTRERTTAALVESLEGGDAVLARAALQELLSRGKMAAAEVIEQFPGHRKVDRRIPEQALRPLEEHGSILWLAGLQPSIYAPLLLPLMRSDSDDTRYYATLIVAREGSDEFIPDIVERVFDRDDQTRGIALRFVESVRGSRPMNAQIPAIRLRLREGDEHSRSAAISALMILRDELCIPSLIELLGQPSLHERAATALTRIAFLPSDLDAASWTKWHKAHGPDGRLAWLLDAMIHKDRRVRENASKELRMTPRLTVNYHPDLDRDALESARRTVQRFFAR